MFSIKISCCTVLSCVDIQFFALYKFYRKLKRVHTIFRNDYTKFNNRLVADSNSEIRK